MREIVHLQAGQCGNQIGAKVSNSYLLTIVTVEYIHSEIRYYWTPGTTDVTHMVTLTIEFNVIIDPPPGKEEHYF